MTCAASRWAVILVRQKLSLFFYVHPESTVKVSLGEIADILNSFGVSFEQARPLDGVQEHTADTLQLRYPDMDIILESDKTISDCQLTPVKGFSIPTVYLFFKDADGSVEPYQNCMVVKEFPDSEANVIMDKYKEFADI